MKVGLGQRVVEEAGAQVLRGGPRRCGRGRSKAVELVIGPIVVVYTKQGAAAGAIRQLLSVQADAKAQAGAREGGHPEQQLLHVSGIAAARYAEGCTRQG